MADGTHARSALITGASRGIGLAIARRLAARNIALTITARDEGALTAIRQDLRELGSPAVLSVAADMADPDAPVGVIQRHRDEYGDMSALILNAGVGTAGSIADYPLKRLDKTIAVNFRSPFVLIQEALPLLRSAVARHPSEGAKIIVLSSITAIYAEAQLAAYGASKAAIASLVDTLNAEESGNGISASAIAPAYVDTDMSEWVRGRIPPEEMIPADDVATMVECLLRMSARSVIGRIVIARAGTDGYEA